jgi:hypothetical protein
MSAAPSSPSSSARSVRPLFNSTRALLLVAAALAAAACAGTDERDPEVTLGPEAFGNLPGAAGGSSTGAGMGGGSSTVSTPVANGAGSLCVSGQARCNGGRTLETCNATGSAFTATACEGTQVCLAGACRQPSCSSGELLCLGNEIHTCNSDGKSTTLARTCATGSACNPDTRACSPTLCEPLVGACNGTTATRCDATGFAYNTSANTACGAGQRCERGFCLNPEQVLPNPGAPVAPVPDPGQVTPVTPGTNPMMMQAAPTQVCTPSAVTCDGSNTISTCSADGLGETITRCNDG